MHINIINRLTITIVTRSQDHGLGELQVGEDAVGHLVAQRGEAGLDVAAARPRPQLPPDHLPTQLPQTQRVRRRVEQDRLADEQSSKYFVGTDITNYTCSLGALRMASLTLSRLGWQPASSSTSTISSTASSWRHFIMVTGSAVWLPDRIRSNSTPNLARYKS